MNMNQKGFANILLIVLVVVLAGVAGYFELVKKQEPVAQQTITPPSVTTQIPTTQPPASTPKDKTADWKIYRNDKYGFEFKYPNKYFLHSDNANIDFSAGQPSLALERYSQAGREGGEFVILKIFSNPSRSSVLDWLKGEGRGKTSFFSITTGNKFGYDDYKIVSVGDVNGITFSPTFGGIYEGAKANETVFGKETFIFDFWAGRFFSKDQELEQDADKIISTFKFIK